MKQCNTFKLALFMFLFPAVLFSQDETWEIFLNSESVSDLFVFEDKVWCATNGGVVAFDKVDYTLEHFNSVNSSLEFAHVNSCSFTNESNLLFGNKGLHVFDGEDWSVYDETNSVLPSNTAIYCMAKGNNGTSLLGMANGEVYRFADNAIEYVTDLCVSQQFFEFVNDIHEESNNSLWIAGELGLCHHVDGATTIYTSNNSGLSHSSVRSIDIDNFGFIWIGTLGGGVNKFDGLNWTTYNMFDIGLFSNKILSLHIDDDNTVWAGTEGGLARFQDNQWTAFTTQNSEITGNIITSIDSDSEGVIYIGTKFEHTSYTGLNIFKNGEWDAISLSNSTLGANGIEDIEQNVNHHILVAAGSNLSEYKLLEWQKFQAPDYGPWPNLVHDIEFDSENIPWVLLVNGIAKVENGNYSFFNHIGNLESYDYFPRTLAIDEADRKWLGTDEEGIYIFDGTSWSNFDMSNSALISNNINDIERDINGDMWVACGLSGGLFHVEDNNWTHYTNQNTELPENTANWVYEIEFDENNTKYLGTHSLCIFNDPFGSWEVFNTLNSELPQIDVDAIAIEENGTLWIGTGNGLAKLKDGEWTIYNQSNSPITDNAISDILIDHDNNKWIGTSSGGLLLLNDNLINSTKDVKNKDLAFNIVPNPSSGAFTIINNTNNNFTSLEIYNSLGQSVLRKNYFSNQALIQVQLPGELSGIYYCKITSGDSFELQAIMVSK